MSGAPSPLKWRVVARTPPTFTRTCSFTSPASQSTATTGSCSTSLLSTTPTTGTTRRLLLLILTGPGAMSPTRQLSPGPVRINNSSLLVVPVVGVVLSSEVLQLPVVAVDCDAGLVKLHVLVNVGGVRATTLHFKGDGAPDIDFFVTSLGGDPVRGVLAADEALHDGAFGLEVLSNDIDIASPGTLGAGDMVRRPDVGSVLASP